MIDDDTDWTLIDFTPPKPEVSKELLPKGTCSKCGKHIGRGLHSHEKSCDPTRASRRGQPVAE